MAIDMKLAAKGRGEPRIGLTEQGNVSADLAAAHAAALQACGWSPDDTEALRRVVKLLESERSAQVEARGGAKGATTSVEAAVTAAKAYKRKLEKAVKVALRRGSTKAKAEDFHAGRELGRSAGAISDYLNNIRHAVKAMDPDLAPYFGGASALAQLDAAKADLDAKNARQEVDWKALPHETLEVYEAKGRLLTMIEDLNTLASIAFDGQATLIGQFNKDVLLRARKERKDNDGGTGAGAAGGGGPGPQG